MNWVKRADELLYDGESVREEVTVGSGGVVVTTHRVLAFTPDREGSNYRAVDRPDVDGIGFETSGELPFLLKSVKAIVIGLVLLAAGMTVNLEGVVSGIDMSSGGTAGAVGLGQMMGLMQTMLSLLAQLDGIMRLFGGLALAFGTVVLAVYLWSRERLLVISVAGEDDIQLTAPEDDGVLNRLERALIPGDGSASAGTGAPATDDPLA